MTVHFDDPLGRLDHLLLVQARIDPHVCQSVVEAIDVLFQTKYASSERPCRVEYGIAIDESCVAERDGRLAFRQNFAVQIDDSLVAPLCDGPAPTIAYPSDSFPAFNIA